MKKLFSVRTKLSNRKMVLKNLISNKNELQNVYKDFANDVEKRSNTSNYEVEGPVSLEINKNVIGLI